MIIFDHTCLHFLHSVINRSTYILFIGHVAQWFNKHKSVQKVAKKNIILIYFELSARISFVH